MLKVYFSIIFSFKILCGGVQKLFTDNIPHCLRQRQPYSVTEYEQMIKNPTTDIYINQQLQKRYKVNHNYDNIFQDSVSGSVCHAMT